jgi:hypothetical protein
LHEHHTVHPKKRSFLHETRTFAIFFGAVFVSILVFTNLELFSYSFRSLFEQEIHPTAPISTSIVSEDGNISTIVDTAQKNDIEIQ